MQKYYADKKTTQADGAVVHHNSHFGLLARVDNCRLENLAGDMRRTVYATGDADTAFSIPAVCKLMGTRVRGYLTSDDAGNVVFRQVYY